MYFMGKKQRLVTPRDLTDRCASPTFVPVVGDPVLNCSSGKSHAGVMCTSLSGILLGPLPTVRVNAIINVEWSWCFRLKCLQIILKQPKRCIVSAVYTSTKRLVISEYRCRGSTYRNYRSVTDSAGKAVDQLHKLPYMALKIDSNKLCNQQNQLDFHAQFPQINNYNHAIILPREVPKTSKWPSLRRRKLLLPKKLRKH